jgi:hypothetical protein
MLNGNGAAGRDDAGSLAVIASSAASAFAGLLHAHI